ncbi:kinase-like domain-containing protein [Mycena belliarum]|uniref:Kinase-like domain-containing protein n=1 Tax=Mycena belliarum TaxID=1033014 RepID=A0AAD6UAY3_9AGAR|nr:kinase-like domain-containing protein [Mycena belliae]
MGAVVSVGRHHKQTIVLSDPTGLVISMHHAVFYLTKEEGVVRVLVEDTSTNGTYINGARLGGERTVLTHDDVLSFGKPVADGTWGYRYKDARPLLERYRLGPTIGRGSYGEVCSAIHLGTRAQVAVKTISASPSGSPRISEDRLKREGEIMKMMRHPNICELLEAFWNRNGTIDLVMEYVNGGELLEYISAQGKGDGLDESTCQHISYQICEAVAHIQSQNALHRDLKPENILLTLDDPPVVKLADFGLATIADLDTNCQTRCGTLEYMAPEVHRISAHLIQMRHSSTT